MRGVTVRMRRVMVRGRGLQAIRASPRSPPCGISMVTSGHVAMGSLGKSQQNHLTFFLTSCRSVTSWSRSSFLPRRGGPYGNLNHTRSRWRLRSVTSNGDQAVKRISHNEWINTGRGFAHISS